MSDSVSIKLTLRAAQLEGHPADPELVVFRMDVDHARELHEALGAAILGQPPLSDLDVRGHG